MLKNGRRFFLRLCLALLACLAQSLAHAQFDKTPWLRTQATPAIDMVDLHGHRWTSAALKGRVVVLNFWATWCGPCKEEMPSLQALQKDPSQGPSDASPAVVIGINVKEMPSTVRRFLAAQHLDLPVVLDPQGDLTRQWGVRIYPTTVLIGADGRARWRVVGDLDWNGPIARAWVKELQALPAISKSGSK
ncbi:TlpA disulfide reductase family protein [Limnohabitans sp.]|jgi:thiol-disulfide isomerase/thioredoxin|uniref:TlpA family protein disulfide reductase n=1 Tax=Limnohabitans sp. TaxID=1907725 RepID=UPI0026256E08|nr:TlpA disulfide reductase family protein [Limnohabitans sp.]